jgi:hypothetical protein
MLWLYDCAWAVSSELRLSRVGKPELSYNNAGTYTS